MSASRFQNRFLTHLAVGIVSFAVLTTLFFAMPILDGKSTLDLIFRLSLASGYVALMLLCLSLGFGVWRFFKRNRKPPVHFDGRRDVGIWAGVFAVFHAVAGLFVHFRGKGFLIYFIYPSEQNAAFPIRLDAFGFANHAGLVAVLIVVLLLAISNDFSIKKLGGGRWKNLQRWNYAFFALVLIHAVLYIVIENRSILFILLAILLFGSTIVLQIVGFIRYRRAAALKDAALSI